MICLQFPGGTQLYASDLTNNLCDHTLSCVSLLLKASLEIISLFSSILFFFFLLHMFEK